MSEELARWRLPDRTDLHPRPSAVAATATDKPEYKVKISACAVLLATRVQMTWNTTTTRPGWSTAARRKRRPAARLDLRHRRLHQVSRTSTTKARAKISFQDVQDCLILVTNCFSTQHVLRKPDEEGHHQQVHPGGHDGVLPRAGWRSTSSRTRTAADRIMEQVLINKRSRETAEKSASEHQEKAHRQCRHRQPRAEVRRLPLEGRLAPRDLHRGGRLRARRHASSRATRSSRASCLCAARFSTV